MRINPWEHITIGLYHHVRRLNSDHPLLKYYNHNTNEFDFEEMSKQFGIPADKKKDLFHEYQSALLNTYYKITGEGDNPLLCPNATKSLDDFLAEEANKTK